MVRGRKPLPTATKEDSGAFVKNPQRRNELEPKAVRGFPSIPSQIEADAVAAECWQRLTRTLDELGILTTADAEILEAYCIDYSQWRWLSEYVREGNCREVNDKGSSSTSPEAQQVHKYADRLARRMVELGLTPSARSRLQVAKREEADPFTEFLQRRMKSQN